MMKRQPELKAMRVRGAGSACIAATAAMPLPLRAGLLEAGLEEPDVSSPQPVIKVVASASAAGKIAVRKTRKRTGQARSGLMGLASWT